MAHHACDISTLCQLPQQQASSMLPLTCTASSAPKGLKMALSSASPTSGSSPLTISLQGGGTGVHVSTSAAPRPS